MRGIVFGGMDGILTTFALLAAVAGSGRTTPALTLVIGTTDGRRHSATAQRHPAAIRPRPEVARKGKTLR